MCDHIKRSLTSDEIKNIISVIKVRSNIPTEILDSVACKLQKDLEEQLEKIIVYPSIIPLLKKKIEKQYQQTLAQPGECVGVLTAQSIGERQTQLTLNSFHSAGLAIATVVTGVPRFSELLNATKNPKSVICSIDFNRNNESIKKLRREINHTLVELTLKDLTLDFKISFEKEEEEWYSFFKILYNDKFKNHLYCISYNIDIEKLYEYYLNIEDIAKKIDEEYDDLFCVFSPTNIGKLDIFVDTSNISFPGENVAYVNKENAPSIYIEEVVIPTLDKIIICGISGVKEMYFRKNDDKWIVDVLGSNFQKLLAHSGINGSTLISNDMWDIYNNLGIEASREFLIEEFMNVVSSDGTFINVRHIKLLVDIMTFTGSITSISRYGMKKDNSGALAKASFEESLDNFLKAGVQGEIETTNGVSASIICGKRSKIGTGLCELMIDIEQLKNRPKIFKSDKVVEREINEDELPLPIEEKFEEKFDDIIDFDFED